MWTEKMVAEKSGANYFYMILQEIIVIVKGYSFTPPPPPLQLCFRWNNEEANKWSISHSLKNMNFGSAVINVVFLKYSALTMLETTCSWS